MRGLPTGLYQPGNSFLHRINAAAKIFSLLFLIVAVIFTTTIWGYLVFLALIIYLIIVVKADVFSLLSSIYRLKFFFLIILLMNLLFNSPGTAWVRFWIFSPSKEGLLQGIHVVARVMILLTFSNIMMVTTPPLKITQALEWMLYPFSFIGLPTDLIAMILSVAIQFIPVLFEETDMIRKAQTARGARFDSRNIFHKAKAVVPLLVPIFLSAFKRADELSLAMEARGYRVDRKSRRRVRIPFSFRDFAALFAALAVMMLFIIVR